MYVKFEYSLGVRCCCITLCSRNRIQQIHFAATSEKKKYAINQQPESAHFQITYLVVFSALFKYLLIANNFSYDLISILLSINILKIHLK